MAHSLNHLGIIADGNRRWARSQNLPIIEGHKKGLEVIELLTDAAAHAGIPYLTFYVFSTENHGRSPSEVDYIMRLAESRIIKYAKKLAKNNAKLLVLGSRDHLSPKMLAALDEAEAIAKDGTGITVCFCFNYGGEQEIVDAANAALQKKLAAASDTTRYEEALDAKFTPITVADLRAHLYHPEVPNLDLVVRTSGEERISGFMLPRAAYAEFLFLKKYFPEMTAEDIDEIVAEFETRERRFGK